MKKIALIFLSFIIIAIAAISCGSGKKSAASAGNVTVSKDFYSFDITDIDGNKFSMADMKGKKLMIVNVASKCGFTPQYEQLQSLYEKYRGKGFVIIGFPANNFMSQEPGTDLEIKEFCTSQFNVTFPMMSKISVKGEDIHPLYSWLTRKDLNGVADSGVKWNFQKYLISEEGKLIGIAYSRERPDSERITRWIEQGVVPEFEG